MSKCIKYFCSISMVTALVACGGGGGAGAPADAPSPAPPTWQGAQFLPVADGEDAQDVEVAINADGVGHAVWSKSAGNVSVILSARYANGAWDAARLIGTPGELAIVATGKSPQVAALPNGDALATWLDGTRVMFSRTLNGNWQKPLEMQDGVGTLANLKMATDGNNNALAVWQRADVVFARYFKNGAFEPGVVRISDDGVDAGDAIDIAMDSSGRALAVWIEEITTGGVTTTQMTSRIFKNGVWSPSSVEIDDGATGKPLKLAAGMDANGGMAAVWTLASPNNASVRLKGRLSFDGVFWVAPKTMSDVDAVAESPDVAVGPAGQVMVVFARRALGANRTDIVAIPKIGANPVMAVETDDAGKAQAPKVAFDANGRASAVWIQFDGTRVNIMTNRNDPASGQWGTPEAIEDDGANDALDGPSLAANANGRAIAAWRHRVTGPSGVNASIMANVFK